MKPIRVFLFILVVFALLFAVSYIYHETDILPDNKSSVFIPHYSSAIPFLKERFLHKTTPDTSIALNSNQIDQGSILVTGADELLPETEKRKDEKTLFQSIEYPPGMDSVLNHFFSELITIRDNKGSTRILHYGDSQIEGDRITSLIREYLQNEFGGKGPGLLLPGMVVPLTASVKMKSSKNWRLFTRKEVNDSVISNNKLGVMLQFSGFSNSASFSVRNSSICPVHAKSYDLCTILYGNNKVPVSLEIKSNGIPVKTDTLKTIVTGYMLKSYRLESPEQLEITFKSTGSIDLYGIALDGSYGVSMDNIPLRGSAGLEFTKTDRIMLEKMYHDLNVSLVLLQFGVNVAPNIVESYSYYEHAFYRQLKLLKQIKPDLSIVVMGISDMARKEETRVVSYPNLEKIRDAQKNAAFKAGCAFWDSYEAMGGEGSMTDWANGDPPLARKDFIHLTYTGSNKLAEMFLKSLMSDFRKYEKSIKTKWKP
ncbi:MAG: hypothetical protein J7K53_07845 [Bacteroidales bacterium]|nr:hypothetical protein [Bacteroidales bacterium]